MPDALGHQNIGFEYLNGAAGTATTVACTLNSLANNAQQSSAAVFCFYGWETGMGGIEYSVMVKVKTGAAVSGTPLVNVYIAASNDGGTTWSDGVANIGTDHSVTLTSPLNVRALGQINCPSPASVYIGGPWSVAQIFGGQPPTAFCLIIENKTGGALDSTNGGTITHQPATLVTF